MIAPAPDGEVRSFDEGECTTENFDNCGRNRPRECNLHNFHKVWGMKVEGGGALPEGSAQ